MQNIIDFFIGERRKSTKRRKSPRRKSTRVKKTPARKWITHRGKLGGPGFLNKTKIEQKRILDTCVQKHGYRSCLGSIMVLERNTTLKTKYGTRLKSLRKYLKDTYGGKGSFKKRNQRKSHKSRNE